MPVTIEKENKKTGTVEERTYETVAERLRRFREKYPVSSGWSLTADAEYDGKVVRFKAYIKDPDRRTVATGHAEETRGDGYINVASAVENCETSALGRVLFAAGFGGGEFCSADELLTALQRQENLKKVEMSLKKETVTQKTESAKHDPLDKKTPTVEDKPPSPTGKDGKDDKQSQHKATGNDGLSELPDGLPKLDGVRYKRENSHVIAEGSAYRNRNDLKDAGFTFSQSLKKWVYAM